MELTTGLYVEKRTFIVKGVEHYNSTVYAVAGYCFYDKYDEVYDEEGNLVENPEPNQRVYYTSLITPITDIEELKDRYIAVRVEDGFEIA
jgi:hypothetical protein